MVFGNCGVLQEMDTRKSYVEMTSIDQETSKDIEDAITSKGGRYLEAQLQGSKQESEDGQLVILCSGDRSLYDDCLSAFSAMGKNSFFLNSKYFEINSNNMKKNKSPLTGSDLTFGNYRYILSTAKIAGSATKMNLVLQLVAGVMISGLAEGMALADRIGLDMKDVMDVMKLTSMACPLVKEKGACK